MSKLTGVCAVCGFDTEVHKAQVPSYRRLCVYCAIEQKMSVPDQDSFRNDVPCGVKTCEWTGSAKYTSLWNLCDKCGESVNVRVEGITREITIPKTFSVEYALNTLGATYGDNFMVSVRNRTGDKVIRHIDESFRELELWGDVLLVVKRVWQ